MNLTERRNKDPHQMAMFKKMKTDHKLLEYCAEHHQPESLDKTFEDIWNEEKYKTFREGLENGNPNPWCQSCNIYNGKRF